ncbi:SMC-Scp complex subunit ScpB [Leucobacter rhizosphaerae]|uniref:SMC-Scp complex subunit ScpB n=1 Tax=Leucobacter rhizosphaerae TaxID=2932245 RepID=A0ABY4FZ07_9MICO|nr:SMC-Scp complex subunit ScpB [Leucobacter rhizosphaerae]UOQ61549.1 SMC-Scp complex subunit ScpB [Leucobacter rhizosphaerae]
MTEAEVRETTGIDVAGSVGRSVEAQDPAQVTPEHSGVVEATELSRAREAHSLAQQLEALLIVADEPLSAVTLATATDRPVREVRAALMALIAEFDGAVGGAGGADGAGAGAAGAGAAGAGSPRGFELREVAGGYRFYVRASLDPIVADFVQQQTPSKLSQAALETLAVIAYRQPISRGAIASIRAVNVDSVVRTLLGRGLITEVGQDPETTATLYGTSEALLGHLGIGDVSELPPIAPLLEDGSEGFDHEQF